MDATVEQIMESDLPVSDDIKIESTLTDITPQEPPPPPPPLPSTSSASSAPSPKIQFTCENCGFNEACEYKGLNPTFAKKIQFTEECYVMQDPFSPPPGKLSDKSNSEYFIVLGADCSSCHKVVCVAATCSIFYMKTYCLQCAYRLVKDFPLEVQSKIRKLTAAIAT